MCYWCEERKSCLSCGKPLEQPKNGDFSGTLNSLVSLVAKQDEYIDLLTKEGGECAVLASVHGWKSKRYEAGCKLRAEIEQLKKETNDAVIQAVKEMEG